MKRRILFCLLCVFMILGLTACGEDGVKVNSTNALARKLASDSAVKINVSKDIVLDEPIVVNGEKEIVGSGKIVAAVEGNEELYMITVADGGKLTIGGSVKIDASGLMGAVHVQNGGSAIIKGKAVVKNASILAANALVEGTLEVQGGNLKAAKGHNVINKNTTTISGGKVTGSGDKYAGIYNEGTLSQTGGKVSEAYNNISNMSGATFTFEGGSNEDSIRDGVFVAEGATLKVTNKDATIVNAGARGILLQGQADIKVITVKECGDTLVKVGKTGVLNLGNGILQGGNYHGVDNAGTMNMLGGNISLNANCGIVNTGTLKVSSGNISENANKGILNKHEGKADVTSAMVTLTSNKTAIANEDKAVFEFAKAKLLMSTQTNIYCYDGTMNIHDASLNASTSNNIRIVDGEINMLNVEVKGNSQKSGTSHHGIYMEGGVINAENVTVSMTTGNGIRNKGGVFKGKNIIMHDINRVAVSQAKHDYLEDVQGLTEINGLEIQSTNYANIFNEGGGTIKITNGKLAVAASNSVRSNDGKMELTNVTIPGHKEGSKDNIHGIYLEGGEISAKNVVIQNTSGNALRNKNGKFVGKNIKMTNIQGQSAIWNLPLNDEEKDGIIDIDGLTIKNSISKDITLDSGVTTIRNAVLGKTTGNNIKMQNNDATLYLYDVKLEGQVEDATAGTHGIIVEGGNVFGENVHIENTNACGIRSKLGVVDLKNVTMENLGQAGISNSKMTKNKVDLGSCKVKIDGLTITKAATNNIVLDAGTVDIKNAVLGKIETKNHNVKVTGTGVLSLDNVKIAGTSDASKYGIIAEGGDAVLNNVELYDLAKSGIHANKETSSVAGTNITIKNAALGITGSNGNVELKDVKMSNVSAYGIDVSGGKFTIDGLTTSDIELKNAVAGGKAKLTIINGDLCATANHNTHSNGANSLLTLKDVTINGVKSSGQYGIIAEKGGDVALESVTVENVKANALHINNVNSKITGTDVTVSNANYAINASNGKVDLKTVDVSNVAIAVNVSGGNLKVNGLTTSEITEKNVVSGGTSKVKIINGDFCATPKHNAHSNGEESLLTLENVNIKGVTSTGQYGIIAEKGGDVALKGVTVENVKANALHINNADSEITGTDVTVSNANYGINASNGTVTLKTVNISGVTNAVNVSGGNIEIEDLVTENVKEKNIHVPEQSINTLINVKKAVLCQTGSHNVHAKVAECLVKLTDVDIQGTSSVAHHALMAEGGDFELNNVTISGVTAKEDRAAIRVNTASSEITGSDVKIVNANLGISASTGSINIKGYTSNAVRQNINASGSALITLSKAVFDKTPLHNIEVSGGSLTLDKATVQGISGTSGTVYGIKLTGANTVVKATDLTVEEGLTAAISVSDGTFDGKKVILKGATSNGVQTDSGKVTIDGLTATGFTNAALNAGGSAEVTVKNANVTGGTRAIENIGSSKAVKVENLEATGQSEHGIYNVGEYMYIGGVIKSSIYNDAPVTLRASSSLKQSVITLDWAADKMPTSSIAIQFSNAEDAKDSQGAVLFGTNASEKYMPYYYGSQLLLNEKNNLQYTVTNFAELQEVIEEINDESKDVAQATITVAGDIVVTKEVVIAAGNVVRIQDNGTVKTIKRSADYTKGNLFNISAGSALTFVATGTNQEPTLEIDGGSKDETPVITDTDSSLIKNSGTLTVEDGVQLANVKGSTNYCKALAIYANTDSTTTFKGVIKAIEGQYVAPSGSGYGVAITVTKVQDFVIEEAIIKDNFTPESGIIRLEAGGKLTIKNSTFENNESVKEAGVISESGNVNNRLTIEGSIFKNNRTSGNGGVMSLSCTTKDNITISGTTFTNNTGSAGAVINMVTGASITLSDCTFTENVTTNTSTAESKCGYGDIRLGGNHESGGIYISGKMIVDIYMNQAGRINVTGALTTGSDVVANWRLGKIVNDSFVGINYVSEDVMNTSKEYISLSDNYNSTYVIKNVDASGTLVKPTLVTSETELKNAINAIGETLDKTGFIKVTKNFTISETVSIPTGVNVTILDDGSAKTITRVSDAKDKTIFDVASDATFVLVATSKNNEEPTLTIDGGSASIINTNGAALINAYGNVEVGKGVVLTNNKSTGNNQGFGIYSQTGSVTTFSGVISNIEGTHSSVKGNVFVIKGAFTLKDAIVSDNKAVAGSPIRVQGGQLTALNTTFQGNSTNGNGGVLYADGTAGNTLTIDGCTFTGNTAGGHGGVISIENTFDANIIKNSKFSNNTAGSEGGAINMVTGAFLTLENCEFTGNNANKVSATDSISGFGDIRVADNTSAGAIRISGKMIVDIYFNQAGKLVVNGALTEGSHVIANWRIANPKKITGNTFTGINFASVDVMEASKQFIEQSDNYKSTYDLTFDGASGILKKK